MAKQEPPKDFLEWLGLTEAPRWGAARPLGALFSVVLILLFFAALLAAFAELGRAILRPESGGGIGAGALIVALLGAPFLIWNTVIKHKALGYQKEGLITDRIAKMVEQLGAEKTVKKEGKGGATVEWSEPNIEVRIGALYALERIAQDSVAYDKGRDHIRLMEILCAYVRQNAPVGNLVEKPAVVLKAPRLDIQVAIDVLKRRSPAQREIEKNRRHRINLSSCNLDGCDFAGADLTAMNFGRSSVARADFSRSDLTAADFVKASVRSTDFDSANLDGTDFSFAVGPTDPEYGLNAAKIGSVYIFDSNLEDFHIKEDQAPRIFGSLGTKIHPSQRDDQVKGLKVAARLFLMQVVGAEAVGLQGAETLTAEQTLFLHWFPFSTLDISNPWRSMALGRFNEKRGLLGWPYDNN